MTLVLEDELCVLGTPVHRVFWLIIRTHTLLLVSPTADAALRQHAEGAAWRNGETDLDFVLCDLATGAGADRREVVDYAFLTALPQPPRSLGQSVGDRQAQLKQWMEACIISYNQTHFPILLRGASPTLHFEYDSVLKNIGGGGRGGVGEGDVGCQRGVQGLVLPAMDGSGGSLVRLRIPLLLTHTEKAYQALNNVAVLYCKFAHHEWRVGFPMSVVEADLVVRIRVSAKTGKLSVLSEDVDLRILERSAAAGSDPRMLFLKSCVNLHGLPRLSLTQQGCGFIDYLPLLDSALYRRIREPLHFMKLVLGLCADFGSPIELSVSCKSLSAADSPQISPARRTAVFCVVDSASSVAFTVGLHYYSGEELPSIETTCTQYMDYQHDVPLSMKVKYPKACAAMPKDDDGFLDVEEVRLAMVHGVMEAIALSMTAAA